MLGIEDPVWIFRSLKMLVSVIVAPRRSLWVGADDGGYDGEVCITRRPGVPGCRQVQSLADLDPNDDTLLYDGSPRINAEVIRHVAMNLAGRSA